MPFNDVPLRTRRAILLLKVYGDSALMVLNKTLSKQHYIMPFWHQPKIFFVNNALMMVLTAEDVSGCGLLRLCVMPKSDHAQLVNPFSTGTGSTLYKVYGRFRISYGTG